MHVLLWGQLKIDYAPVGASDSAVARFNTVGEGSSHETVERILGGIDWARAAARRRKRKPRVGGGAIEPWRSANMTDVSATTTVRPYPLHKRVHLANPDSKKGGLPHDLL